MIVQQKGQSSVRGLHRLKFFKESFGVMQHGFWSTGGAGRQQDKARGVFVHQLPEKDMGGLVPDVLQLPWPVLGLAEKKCHLGINAAVPRSDQMANRQAILSGE